jgi:hypothetical protein
MASFVAKTKPVDPRAPALRLPRMKTMYGGKAIAAGDEVFVFADGCLAARGVATKVAAVPRPRGAERWTPRVSVEIGRLKRVRRGLGRDDLKPWRGVRDGSPQAELDFKFFRQATDKIGAISDGVAAFLRSRF